MVSWPPGEVEAEHRAWLEGSPRKQAEVEGEGALADKNSLLQIEKCHHPSNYSSFVGVLESCLVEGLVVFGEAGQTGDWSLSLRKAVWERRSRYR